MNDDICLSYTGNELLHSYFSNIEFKYSYCKYDKMSLNPFYSSVLFLYLPKTSENPWFSDDFRGYRNVTLD